MMVGTLDGIVAVEGMITAEEVVTVADPVAQDS